MPQEVTSELSSERWMRIFQTSGIGDMTFWVDEQSCVKSQG